ADAGVLLMGAVFTDADNSSRRPEEVSSASVDEDFEEGRSGGMGLESRPPLLGRRYQARHMNSLVKSRVGRQISAPPSQQRTRPFDIAPRVMDEGDRDLNKALEERFLRS